jgi:tetratricopeptide (TPR) repeat protein
MLRSHLLCATAIALASPSLVACGAHHPQVPVSHAERLAPPSNQVTDDGFAGAVHDLLVTPPRTPEHAIRLAGVESRQMARAAERFHNKAAENALVDVRGGLALVQTGELEQSTLGPQGVVALDAAARELATRGDEGRARAIYEILARIAPDSQKADVKGHLDAIAQWDHDSVAHGGPLESAGEIEKVAVRRRLLEPSQEALADAVAATSEWIKRALDLLQRMQNGPRIALAREEAIEAHRALGSGGAALVSLYLKDADAQGGLAVLDRAGAREMIPQELLKSVEAAADEPTPGNWVEVVKALRPLGGHGLAGAMQEEDDFTEDRDLYREAAFGSALEAYRLDPAMPEAAMLVAQGLEEMGMAEASPAVLVEATAAHRDPRTASAAMAVTMRSMQMALESNDVDGARRTFRAARPLLEVADGRPLAGKVQPSSARVRAFMGEAELAEGHIDEARALLKASAASERSGRVMLTLARIEQHDGQGATAIDSLRDALGADDTNRDPALRGEILLLISDIMRETGAVDAARTPLTEALRDLVQARGAQAPEERARVERTLARVLDRFGDDKSAERALERALQADPGDKNQSSLTIGQLVGRAFVRGDLAAAREGLTRAIAADLDNDDLVYLALWVRLLERQQHVPTDGTPDRIFAVVLPQRPGENDAKWTTKLAEVGAGKLAAAALLGAAQTAPQRTEALFYAAMDKAASGDKAGEMEALRQVIGASAVQLMEVSFARDLLDGQNGQPAQVGGPLPSDVRVP